MEKELQVQGSKTFDKIVEGLIEANKRGEEVYFRWNGIMLHSKGATEDSLYKQVFDMTKQEHDEHIKKIMEAYQQELKEEKARALASIDTWVERGNELIYEERQDDWRKCVEVRANDLYNGEDLEAALAIMEALDKGATIEEANELFKKQDHSGASAAMTRNIILHFSKQGPKFYRETAAYINSEADEIIRGIEEENQKYEENKKEVTK